MMRFSLRPLHGAVALLIALGCLAGGRRLAAQQPTTQQPADQQPAAQQPPARPRDPRAIILDKLRRLDARPDTARDTTAVRDSTRDAFELSAPTATARPTGGAPGAAPIPDDSISSALALLTGFTATKYQAESARFYADTGRLVLRGSGKQAPAEVIQGDQAMTADSSLVFNQKTQIACGFGKPVLTGAGQQNPVQSDLVCYDVESHMGVAYGATTKFQPSGQSSAWFVDGHKLYTTGSDKLFAREAEFTDCDLIEKGKEPHYHFTASQVKIVKSDVLVARNVILSFGDVPVFWLPFMMQSTAKGRHSGILMPRFDLNDIARTNTNYQRRITNFGFYWAINDHFGELTSLDWFSNNWTALNTALDWSFRRQFLSGSAAVKQYWRSTGRELTLNASNSWRPDERTTMNVSANYATSSQFVLDQSFDPRELNRSIDSNLGIQRRFNWGSLDLAGSRRQMLQTNRVTMKLPAVSLSLSPISILGMTWQGSGNYAADQDKASDYKKDPSHSPSKTDRQAGFNSSLSLGKFAWGQSINYTQNNQLLRPADSTSVQVAADSFVMSSWPKLPANSNATMNWSTSLGFQQRLIGTSSINPSLSISGQSQSLNAVIMRYRKLDATHTAVDTVPVNYGMTPAPVRLNFGVGTQMDVYGFWPGVGPFARIRHKLSPSFSYAYSPAPKGTITQAQRDIYGQTVGAIAEVNKLTFGVNQTFEAKYRESAKDTAAADSAANAANEAAAEGEPRRLPQARKMTLLSLNTSAVAYDFTQDTIHHRTYGFGQTLTLSNDIRSDLIPGLQFSLQHSLIDTTSTGKRRFSPFLTNASTSFSLSDNSWLFRFLGLAGRHRANAPRDTVAQDTTSGRQSAADQVNSSTGLSIVPREQRQEVRTPGGVGSWNAQFTYNLARQRPDKFQAPCVPSVLNYCPSNTGSGTQMIQGRFTFQPTPNWRVAWQTGYNVTDGKFSDHVLTLSRDLHDWEANFDFVKAQNGNFTVQFRVNLKAQPDLKFDYRQASGGGYTGY